MLKSSYVSSEGAGFCSIGKLSSVSASNMVHTATPSRPAGPPAQQGSRRAIRPARTRVSQYPVSILVRRSCTRRLQAEKLYRTRRRDRARAREANFQCARPLGRRPMSDSKVAPRIWAREPPGAPHRRLERLRARVPLLYCTLHVRALSLRRAPFPAYQRKSGKSKETGFRLIKV